MLHTPAKRDWMNTVSEFLTEVPETHHVSRECSFANILYLRSIGACNVISHFEFFCTFTLVLSKACGQCAILVLSEVPRFRLFLYISTCFLNNFEIFPFTTIMVGITFVFAFHMLFIPIVGSLYFIIFSVSFLVTFLSPEISTSFNIHISISLSRIVMSSLLLGTVLSVGTC